MGLGEILALACAVAWGTAVVLYKYIGNSMGANTLNLVKNMLGLAFLLPTALVVEGVSIPQLSGTAWLIVFVSGYFGIAVADTLYLQALRHIGASRTAIVSSLYSPFVVLLSIIFLGERLALWQWWGFFLVMAGIFVVVYQRTKGKVDSTVLLRGALMAAFSIFLTAAGIVAMKPILENDGFFWMVSLRMLAGVLGMYAYLIFRGQIKSTWVLVRYGDHKWGAILTASFCGSYMALLFWLGGFKYTEASIASILNETANIFIVLMAAIFLKESLSWRKGLGVFLTFSGVLVFLGLVI